MALTGADTTIKHSEFSIWFSITRGEGYTGICEISEYGLYTSSACTTTFSQSEVTLSGSLGSQTISISTTAATSFTTMYLCIKNNIFQSSPRQVDYQVCGSEVISLTQSTLALELSQGDGTSNVVTYASTKFTALF